VTVGRKGSRRENKRKTATKTIFLRPVFVSLSGKLENLIFVRLSAN
jgi:hypothetical protein